MDMEQILKQVDWLDEERRRDKTRLGSMEERVIGLEENIPSLANQMKDLSSQVNRLSAVLTRMDHFDENLLQQRIETKQYFDELERQIQKIQTEGENIRRAEISDLETSITEIDKKLDNIPEIQRRIDARIEEELRLTRSIEEVRNKFEDVKRSEEEYTRTIRLLDDGRRQDTKRMTDLQGEITAVRKHVDEQRGQIELNSVASRKLETRMNELDIVEAERREVQEAFLENQALQNVQREREWKEWQARFDQIEQQTMDVENNLQTLDVTHRDIKRTQQNVDELAQKLDRRINEITEIQRLAEERFRQEWVTFKADDQKRWTNYSLTQDEQRNESTRQQGKITDKVTNLEDSLQEINDLLQQVNELSEKRLQSIRALVHEWVSEYERAIGPSR
jgi:DNA repair exonuclease SbcCD ATPase subunit